MSVGVSVSGVVAGYSVWAGGGAVCAGSAVVVGTAGAGSAVAVGTAGAGSWMAPLLQAGWRRMA